MKFQRALGVRGGLIGLLLAARVAESYVLPALGAGGLPSGAAWAASTKCAMTDGAAPYYQLFGRLASDPVFAQECFGKKPVLLRASDICGGDNGALQAKSSSIADTFTLDDVARAVDSDFLDAGRGDSDPTAKSGWRMAPVSVPRGASFEDAKMRHVDVLAAMKKGTVVFNSAGASFPELGAVCLAAQAAFKMPAGINLYLTAKGTATSAPPHTDKQDVFVLQTKGAKHWRVFSPPPPQLKPEADPLARGKGADGLSLDGELLSQGPDGLLVECVLRPGDCLYIPAGWPHTTDTVNTAPQGGDQDDSKNSGADDDSVHITVGLDTHIWGLDYSAALRGALQRKGGPLGLLKDAELPPDAFWSHALRVPPSLGFLRPHLVGPEPLAEAALQAADIAGLVQCARAYEAAGLKAAPAYAQAAKTSDFAAAALRAGAGPSLEPRWAGLSDAEVAQALGAPEVCAKIRGHHEGVMKVQEALYRDTAADLRPPPPGGLPGGPGAPPAISMFRVKKHMDVLEQVMESHVNWYKGPNTVAPSPGFAASPAAGGGMAAPAAKGGKAGFGKKAKAGAKGKGKAKKR